MTEGRNFLGIGIAAGTGKGLYAGFGASGFLGDFAAVVVLRCRNDFLCNDYRLTDGAVLAFRQARFGTSGCNRRIDDLVVTEGRNNLGFQHFAAIGTNDGTFARLGASRRFHNGLRRVGMLALLNYIGSEGQGKASLGSFRCACFRCLEFLTEGTASVFDGAVDGVTACVFSRRKHGLSGVVGIALCVVSEPVFGNAVVLRCADV